MESRRSARLRPEVRTTGPAPRPDCTWSVASPRPVGRGSRLWQNHNHQLLPLRQDRTWVLGSQQRATRAPSPGSTHTFTPSLHHPPGAWLAATHIGFHRAHSCCTICNTAGSPGPCALSQRPCWPHMCWRWRYGSSAALSKEGTWGVGTVGMEGPSEDVQQERARARAQRARRLGLGRRKEASNPTCAQAASSEPSPSPQGPTPVQTRDLPAAFSNKMKTSNCLTEKREGKKSP